MKAAQTERFRSVTMCSSRNTFLKIGYFGHLLPEGRRTTADFGEEPFAGEILIAYR